MKRATRPRADEAREPAADAHGEQVAADDGRELKDAVAEQIAGQRAGDQLIDQPAGGDQEDGEERGYAMATRNAQCSRLGRPAMMMHMPIDIAPTSNGQRSIASLRTISFQRS